MIKPSKRKVAVVDIDLTVVDTVSPWIDYMNNLTGLNFEITEGCQYPYNLTRIYAHALVNPTDTSELFEYWKSKTLYDNLQPLPGSVEALKKLNDLGYDIVFASVLKHGHDKSKYYFLKRHFPFMAAAVFTKEKGYIKADLVIDDRNEYLNQFDGECVTKVRMVTPFIQTVNTTEYNQSGEDVIEIDSWLDFGEVLSGLSD